MTTAAIAGRGCAFHRESGSSGSGTFVALSEVNSIGGPGMQAAMIDVSSLGSDWVEQIKGLLDGGQFSVNLNFTITAFNLLFDDFVARTSRGFRVVNSDTGATTLDVEGFVSALNQNVGGPNEKVTIDATVTITGIVDLMT